MRRKKDRITIKEVRVLGSYGKMYHDCEAYPHSLRKLSKDVKKSDTAAIAIAALLLSQIVAPNSVLIPIPQSSGNAEYTLELANATSFPAHRERNSMTSRKQGLRSKVSRPD